MKARIICLAVILIAICAAKDVEFQNIPNLVYSCLRRTCRFQDLLPVNDISHAREEPISQKIRENVTLLHAHLAESRESRAEHNGGGSTTFSWLQFWVMCASTRNGDYRDG